MMKFLASLALLAIVVSAGEYYLQPDYPCAFSLTVTKTTRNQYYSYTSTSEYNIHGRYTYKKTQSGGGNSVTYTRPDINKTNYGTVQMAQVSPKNQPRQKCDVSYVAMDQTVNSFLRTITDLYKSFNNRTYNHKTQEVINGLTCDCYYDDDINTEAIYVYENYIYYINTSSYNTTLNYTWDAPMSDFQIDLTTYTKCSSEWGTVPPVDLANCPSSSSSSPDPSSSTPVPVPSSSSSPVPVPSSSSSHHPVHSSSSSHPPVHSSSSTPVPVASSSSSGVYSYVQPEFPCAFELTVTTASGASSNVVEIKSFGRYSYERVGIITTVSRPDIHKTVDGTQMMGIFSTWTGDCTMTYGEIDRKVEAFHKSVAEYSAPYNNKKYNFKETKVLDNKTCDCYYDRDINAEAVYVYENYIYRIHTGNTDITFDYSWSEPKMSDFKFDKDESPECEDYDDRVFSTPSKDYSNCGTPVKPSVSSLDSSVRAEAMVLVVIAAIAASLVALF